jgi:hypothetical protein
VTFVDSSTTGGFSQDALKDARNIVQEQTLNDSIQKIAVAATSAVSAFEAGCVSESCAKSVSEPFTVNPIPGGPTIKGYLFIPAPSALFLKGDSQDVDKVVDVTQYRVGFKIDYATGEGIFAVSPTCLIGGGRCWDAFSNGQGSKWNITPIGDVLRISGFVKPSAMKEDIGPGIDFDMLFTANSQRITYDIQRDAFPAFLLSSTINNKTDVLVRDAGTTDRTLGAFCLLDNFCERRQYQGTIQIGK